MKKIILTIAITTIVVCVTYMGFYFYNQNKTFVEYKKVLNDNDVQMIYFGSDNCGFCKHFKVILNQFEELEYHYIDVTKMSVAGVEKFLKEVGKDISVFGTPYVMLTKNGELLDSFYTINEHELMQKFDAVGLNYKYTPYMEYIDYNGFMEALNEKNIILLGNVGQGATLVRFELKDIIEKYNLDLKYYDINFLLPEEDEMMTMFGNEVVLPIFMISENGSVKDFINDDITKEKIVDLLEKNDIINVGE